MMSKNEKTLRRSSTRSIHEHSQGSMALKKAIRRDPVPWMNLSDLLTCAVNTDQERETLLKLMSSGTCHDEVRLIVCLARDSINSAIGEVCLDDTQEILEKLENQ